MASSSEKQSISAARSIFDAAVESVQPDALLRSVDLKQMDRAIGQARRVFVIGSGKASLAMFSVFESLFSGLQYTGLAVVPEGYSDSLPSRYAFPEQPELIEAGHPVPDGRSVDAGRKMLNLANEAGPQDLVLAMISGGTSALTSAPIRQLALRDVKAVTDHLLRAGADIHQINTVRRQLTAVGGGKLAATAHPARVIALVISDVVGNDLHVIGSGPTVPDPTSPGDAKRVLRMFASDEEWVQRIQNVLSRLDRNPSSTDSRFKTCQTRLIGSNRDALHGAAARAESMGYRTVVHPKLVTGEAREVGAGLVHALQDEPHGPVCHIWGGETTVTVRGNGKGGRNQELALSGGIEMADYGLAGLVLSGGTDGIDGPTDAAGAWSSAAQIESTRSARVDPAIFLQENDSYSYFDAREALIKTGPTHTNVMDVVIALSNNPDV